MWGSWWSAGQWGYACCHQTVKNSYCTGAAGHAAAADSVAQMEANLAARAADCAAAEARSSEAVRKVPSKVLMQSLHHAFSCKLQANRT